ncbi:DUF924 family protein [Shewanella waksmanii]|uniref:DUF924 family protein n=1 Tax=Shewanella waksmanii TaxID=213783 RepID=UPI0037360D8E
MTNLQYSPDDIITFWFNDIDPKLWWVKDDDFDKQLTNQFGLLLEQAKKGELYHWRTTPTGRLAEVIVLDQFSRNIYRNTPGAFAADSMALALAQEAVAQGADKELKPNQVPFLYMPYMHSESAKIHDIAMVLFSRDAAKGNLEFERRHKAIIDRFGRYPHRNEILNRPSTQDELEFLSQPGSSF